MSLIDKVLSKLTPSLIKKALIKKRFGSTLILKGKNITIDDKTVFEGGNVIHSNCVFSKSKIGYASYFSPGCRVLGMEIGRYCSFGRNLDVIFSQHPLYNCISTHPVFFSITNYPFSYVLREKHFFYRFYEEGVTVKIGSDVWVGDNVTIMGGVSIGDGAVLAANSVITKDVPSYAIVGGNPAMIIKYRFDSETIDNLLRLQWWNRPESWLKQNADCFYNEDIRELKNTIMKLESL